jgi:hypothetical protein
MTAGILQEVKREKNKMSRRQCESEGRRSSFMAHKSEAELYLLCASNICSSA